MPLGDTSRTQISLIPEAAYGVTPGSGNPVNLRMTGESLDFTLSKDSSKEIRADRQLSDLIVVGADARGGFNFELSYREYDTILEAMLQGTWAAYGTNGVGTTFSATFASGSITAGAAPTGSSAFTNLSRGQWLRVTAPGNANDGLYVRVHAATAPTSTVITLDPATPLVAGGPIANSAIATSRLVNGTTQRSFTFQRQHTDITQFFAFRGMTPSKFSMAFASGAFVTGGFDFIGKDSIRSGATVMPGSPVASQAYDIMNAVTGVGAILENGSALANTFMKTLSFDFDNHLRGRTALGVLGNASIGSGTIECKGSADVYLADGSLYDKFVNNTATSIQITVKDSAGNGYAITFPKIKYGDAKVNAGGKDQDAMITLPWEAMQDPTTGVTIIVDRIGA
jgi:hypothetical protein